MWRSKPTLLTTSQKRSSTRDPEIQGLTTSKINPIGTIGNLSEKKGMKSLADKTRKENPERTKKETRNLKWNGVKSPVLSLESKI